MTSPSAPAFRDSHAAASAALVAILTILRFLYAQTLEAHPDEAYYILWSRHLDFGYLDQPPLIAWLLAGLSRLLGSELLAIRVLPALLSAWASSYVFRLARDTAGSRAAFWSLAAVQVMPLFLAGAMLATIDTPMVLFLAGASYHVHRGVTTGRNGSWLLAGLFAGLALLSKYVAVLTVASFLLCLLLPEHRRWLRRRQPWLALVIALLVFSPQLAWNRAHGWVSFAFVLGRGLGLGSGTFPGVAHVPDYVAAQAAVVGPFFFGLVVAALASVARSWRREPPGRRFLWCLSVVPIGFFLCTSLLQRVQPHWPGFAHIPGIALAVSVYQDRWERTRSWRVLWRLAWASNTVLLGLALPHLHVPLVRVQGDRASEFFGWKELGGEAVELGQAYPGRVLAANTYQLASEIGLYSGLPVTSFGFNYRASQFNLWQEAGSPGGRSFLFFHTRRAEESPVFGHFASCRHIRTVTLRGRGGAVLRTLYVYDVTLPSGPAGME